MCDEFNFRGTLIGAGRRANASLLAGLGDFYNKQIDILFSSMHFFKNRAVPIVPLTVSCAILSLL